jgi:hypothetical protein
MGHLDDDYDLEPDDVREGRGFTMDGAPHWVPGRERCHCVSGQRRQTCPKCGGFMHCQPVHGGYYYKCEGCSSTTLDPIRGPED